MQAYECVFPAGLAAGFDKDAEAVKGLLGLGLGFMEVGEWQQQWHKLQGLAAANGMWPVSCSARFSNTLQCSSNCCSSASAVLQWQLYRLTGILQHIVEAAAVSNWAR
jgi:hypothetical protein